MPTEYDNRVIEARCGTLILRLAKPSDSDHLLRWRNDPVTRAMSTLHQVVSLVDHENWFRNSMQRVDRVIIIGEHHLLPIGMIRYDLLGAEATVSINLAAAARGLGLASAILQHSEDFLPVSIMQLSAVIRADNHASQKTFAHAGYVFHDEDAEHSGHLIYRKAMPRQLL